MVSKYTKNAFAAQPLPQAEPAQTTPKPPDRGKGPHDGANGPHMVVRGALYAGVKERRRREKRREVHKGEGGP